MKRTTRATVGEKLRKRVPDVGLGDTLKDGTAQQRALILYAGLGAIV